mgnify:CR=1 FL=1
MTQARSEAEARTVLDVRGIPPRERHPLIFQTFGATPSHEVAPARSRPWWCSTPSSRCRSIVGPLLGWAMAVPGPHMELLGRAARLVPAHSHL